MDETPKEKAKQGTFTEKDLNESQRADYTYFKKRLSELQQVRTNHYGHNLNTLWAEADRDYIPHRLKTKGKKMIATDEEKGWRGALVPMGSTDWQSDVSQSNPYVKIQTALSILVDQNPTGVFTAGAKKYTATTEIIKQLYERSWVHAKSRPELKKFVFNLAKYGWATGRTYPLRLTQKAKVLTQYNIEDPESSTYETKEVVEYNDIMRENLDPRNVWIDDMAKPNNTRSVRDWSWRKVYDIDVFKQEFGKYKRCALVTPGGNIENTIEGSRTGLTQTDNTQPEHKNLVEVFFYESKQKDLFLVEANKVPVVMEPLPISNEDGVKKLSLWQTYWNLRHAESPYGIGIYEAIRYDQGMLDRIRNMTVDQLTLSIYKMFFYQGTQALTDTGDFKIVPGVGKQVLDPKNINWLEVPGPGKDAYMGMDMFRKDVDEGSGITDPLLGVVTGKTAFEIAQAKESALKRLKNPLDNILEALDEEASTSICLMQLLYSTPEVYEISDPRLIEDYLKETESDPDLYSRGEPTEENPNGTFSAKVYPEFPLNLSKDEKGNLIETEDTKFFRTKPDAIKWQGMVQIKSQSLLSPSKQVDKALELEMYDKLTPLLQMCAQERAMMVQMGQDAQVDNLTWGKEIKNIIMLYDKDPRDIFPDSWLAPQPQQPLMIPAQGGPQEGATTVPQGVQSSALSSAPSSVVGKISQGMSAPFKV